MRYGGVFVFCGLTVLVARSAELERKPAFRIAAGGKPEAAVVCGDHLSVIEKTAIDALGAALQHEAGVAIPVWTREPAPSQPLIVAGTSVGNTLLKQIADTHALPIRDLTPESYLLKTLDSDGKPLLVIAGADPRGVLYGVQEAVNQAMTTTPKGEMLVMECNEIRRPAVRERGTYSLTCWGMAPRYDRAAWEKAIDSMSAAGMNRIMFWMDGLFRSRKFPYTFLDKSYFSGVKLTDDDIHQLIRYAHDRGMEFELGSGVFGWFTSGTFAEKFKEAADHSGNNLCPSHPLAQKLTLDYLSEMMDVFPEADGYMLEIRDEIGDCRCEKCQKPLDDHGSKQFGQSELDLLEKLTTAVWRNHPEAKFIWLMGYANHASDPMYYDRMRQMGKDKRLEWLEVRGSWELPSAEGNKPLRELSDRAYVWGGGYYALAPQAIQGLVQRIVREGLHGYLPAYEPGFGTASIYGERVPFPVDLIPFALTQFYYREFTWDPAISQDRLLLRAHRQFFSDKTPDQLSADLLFLRQLMQDHHTELTCIAPGLIRTSTLAEGVDQIWNDRQMPDKKAKLTQLAQCVRSLQNLSKGGGHMVRLAQIESRMNQLQPTASRRTAESFSLMKTAIDDFRAAVASRHEDFVKADETLEKIDAKIKEYEASKSKAEGKGKEPSADNTTVVVRHGAISIDAPIPQQLFKLRIAHTDLLGALTFMFFEHVNASALKGFPGPTSLRKIGSDALELSAESAIARWTMALRAIDTGADIILSVHNTSSQPWPEIAAVEACVSPRWPNNEDNPILLAQRQADQRRFTRVLSDRDKRKRTYMSITGGLTLLEGMGICFRDDQTLRAITDDKNWISDWWNKTYPSETVHPDRGLLIRHDEATGWTMTLAWDDWTHLKSHDLYDCLHVAPRLGPLAPGASKTIRGRIGLFRASLAEAPGMAMPRADQTESAGSAAASAGHQ